VTDCPTANDLAELVDGTLAAPRRTAIESHLDHCLACTDLVTELGRAITPGELARHWRGTRGELVARWRLAIARVAADHRAGRVYGGLSPDAISLDGDELWIASAASSPYTAVEQLHGMPPSPAGDQFSLCACMWEALAGAPPFRGTTPGALAVVMTTRPEPPDGDPIFIALARGLAADPAARWPDLDALARALEAPRATRGRAWMIVVAVALAAAGATLLYGFR
jgi:hypothetical protein